MGKDESTIRVTIADTGDYGKDRDRFNELHDALVDARLGPYIDYDDSQWNNGEDHSEEAAESARDLYVDCAPGKERGTAQRVKDIVRRLRILADVQVSHIALS